MTAAQFPMDTHMKRNRSGMKPLLCSLVLLALSACGGSENGNSTARSLPATSCTGTAQTLFVAMQGSYYGLVNADYSTGSSLPLSKGKQYVVTVSASNCEVSVVADNNEKIGFTFGDNNSGALSTVTGLSPTKIIKDPTSLDLTGVQYNVGVSNGTLAYELERRVKVMSTGDTVVDGDLFLSINGLNDTKSTYGLDILASSKR